MQPKSNVNVSNGERIVSVTAGSALLYRALTRKNKSFTDFLLSGYLLYRGATGHCVVYESMGKSALPDPVKNINIETSLIVEKPVSEVYAFWRRLENLPMFMTHLKSVEEWDERLSEWKAKLPGNLGTISWKAEIVKQQPNHMIGWNSLPHSDIENAGKVTFIDIGYGRTEITAHISYRAPLGIVGEKVSRLFTPLFEKMVADDIQNFKTFIETEEYLLLDKSNTVIY